MRAIVIRLWTERSLSVLKYIIAAFMIFAGIATALGPIAPAGGDLGWLYAHRASLVFFGFVFLMSGATLLWGKIRRSRKWTGRGLMAIYLCFLFAAILNAIAWGIGAVFAYLPNLLAAIIVGMLYLRWRFKTEYVNPKHFIRDIEYLRPDDERD